MVKYKCGHKSDLIIADGGVLTISAWLVWSESVGVQGDKSMCWECWNKKHDEDIKKSFK